MRTIGIIGGNGWMGQALARAMIETSFVDAPHLTLSSRSVGRQNSELPGVRWTTDNQALVERSDAIVVSVRPEQFSAVCISASGKLLISVMAGVSVRTLQERTQADVIIRAMPNAAATVRSSYTPWVAADGATMEDKHFVQELFETCGLADEVSRESDIDYLTGLTGAGPAYPSLLADAMIGHAVSKGLSPELACRAVRAVVIGTGQLLAANAIRPAEIVQTFLDYRGTTAAALQTMTKRGFAAAVHAGLDAAEARAAELANS